MDWALNHLFLLFIIAGAVASMVQKAKKAGEQQRPSLPPSRGALDPDAAERTRRVQEEIRRKIAERAGRLPAMPQAQAAGPSASPPSRNIFQELARQMAEAKKNAEQQQRAQAAAESQAQQRAEDEQKSRQLAEAQRTLQRQQQTAAAAVAYSAPDRKTTTASARDELLADLREPGSLRRAWMLREILGEPVGLR